MLGRYFRTQRLDNLPRYITSVLFPSSPLLPPHSVLYAAMYTILRVAIGLLFLAAAGLKAHEQVSSAYNVVSNHVVVFSVVEFLFALWLLVGRSPRRTWQVTIIILVIFSFVSIYRAQHGHLSCGCFGQLAVNPWYAACLDAGLLLLLVVTRPSTNSRSTSDDSQDNVLRIVGLCSACVVFFLAIVSTGDSPPSVASDKGESIVFEPESWLQKELPITSDIDISDTISRGAWLLLFYDHRCSSCRDAATELEQLSEQFASTRDPPRIAIIEIPPYGGPVLASSRSLWGRLNTTKWLVTTPLAILVYDGYIQSVFKNPRDTELLRAIWGTAS